MAAENAVAQPDIYIDPRTMREVQELLEGMERLIPRAIRRAINRTTRSLRSRMTKAGAKAMGAKQKTIRERVWQNKARRKLFGKVRAGAVGWPLSVFQPREKAVRGRRGVTVKIKGRREVVENAFMATTRSGHTSVFVRKGKSRLPIVEARSPSLTAILENEGLTPLIVSFGRRLFNSELLDAAEYYGNKELQRGALK